MLLLHPDVAQAVAFGVPDDKYGEEVRKLSFPSNPNHLRFIFFGVKSSNYFGVQSFFRLTVR